jgi:hypothetical protein
MHMDNVSVMLMLGSFKDGRRNQFFQEKPFPAVACA